MTPQIESLSVGFERIAGDQAGPQFGESPLAFARKMGIEILGDDKLEYGITQKLEPLIILMMALFFMSDAWVCQRLLQEGGLAKRVAEALLERVHVSAAEKLQSMR